MFVSLEISYLYVDQQAVQTYIHLLILRCKMLVGDTQTLELHRTDAGWMLSQTSL